VTLFFVSWVWIGSFIFRNAFVGVMGPTLAHLLLPPSFHPFLYPFSSSPSYVWRSVVRHSEEVRGVEQRDAETAGAAAAGAAAEARRGARPGAAREDDRAACHRQHLRRPRRQHAATHAPTAAAAPPPPRSARAAARATAA